MSETLISLIGLARDTVLRPQDGARRVLALPYPRALWWQALALVVILGLMMTYLSNALIPAPADPMMAFFNDAPLVTALIAFGATLAMVICIHRVGRALGGHGSFDGALRLTVWLQAVMLLFNAVQIFFLIALPPFAVLMGFVNIGLTLWLLTNFVAVLHGFKSLFPVFLMILLTGFALGLTFFMLLSMTGALMVPELYDV
jgi:hypothetical protein